MTRDLIKRGPVVAVAKRQYSKPIPAEFLPLIEQAGMVADDNDHTVIFYSHGIKRGSVFGPSVEGHWFAYRGEKGVVTVASRDDGLRHVLDAKVSTGGDPR